MQLVREKLYRISSQEVTAEKHEASSQYFDQYHYSTLSCCTRNAYRKYIALELMGFWHKRVQKPLAIESLPVMPKLGNMTTNERTILSDEETIRRYKRLEMARGVDRQHDDEVEQRKKEHFERKKNRKTRRRDKLANQGISTEWNIEMKKPSSPPRNDYSESVDKLQWKELEESYSIG